MQLAGPRVFGSPRDPAAARAVLRRAVALGVDHIDTSQYYGPTIVNELIRDALHPYPDGLRLVTKVGVRRDDRGGWLRWDRPQDLRAGVEDNLRTLGVERMSLVNLRHLETDVPLPEQLGELEAMRAEGKLELIGVSNMDADMVAAALEHAAVASVQNAYSILERDGEPVLELCRQRGLAFVPFSPLGSAQMGGATQIAADPAIRAVAQRHGATPSQVALAWLLAHDERILLIPGTSSVAHLEENVNAAGIELDADDLARLEDVQPGASTAAG
jgi:aryl-alcohol dehydrogenase-like predicted oxidoreductase